MRKFILLLFITIMVLSIPSYSQVDVRASMGINYVTIPSLRDYINDNFAFVNDKLETFNAEVQFSGEAGYTLGKNFQIGIEYGFSINSYTITHPIGLYEFAYNAHLPSIIAYYVLPGEGYKFKFGFGTGYRIFKVSEKIPPTTTDNKFTSSGLGFLLRGEGSTSLGGNLYANIGIDVRFDMAGEIVNDNNQKIVNPINNETVKMNAFSVGVRLGAAYFF